MTSRLNDAALVAIVLALRDVAGGAGTAEGELLHDKIRTALDNADLGDLQAEARFQTDTWSYAINNLLRTAPR